MSNVRHIRICSVFVESVLEIKKFDLLRKKCEKGKGKG